MNEQTYSETQLREVRAWGNSGGVILPRDWVGKQVRIHLIDKQGEIKRDILKILEPYMDEIIGAYLTGSYSRGEHTEKSDIDILVVSKNLKKKISSGKYEIEIVPLKTLIFWLKEHPYTVYPNFVDAKPIINKKFLEEILEIKITKKDLNQFMKDNKDRLKDYKKALELEEKRGNEFLKRTFVIYSAILRLRALFIMKNIIKKKDHSNKAFKELIIRNLKIDEKEFEKIYSVYRTEAHGKKAREKIPLKKVESLVSLFEKEVNKW